MTSPETVVELPVDQLVPSAANPRFKLRGLEELAESIKEHGVLEPLLVTRNGHNTHIVLAGHRRLAAAKLAGLSTAPCIVRKYEESAQLGIQLVENLQRDDLTELEEAKGYGQLADLKKSTREISRLVGKSQSHVVHRLALLKLSPKVTTDYESGRLRLTVEDVAQLATMPATEQDQLFKETSYGGVKERVRELKWREQERKRAEAAVAAAKNGKQTEISDPTIDRYRSEAEAANAKRKREDKLRREANEARALLLPRLVGRGERELQYAAVVMAHDARTDEGKIACEVLGLEAKKRQYGYPDYSLALAEHVTSKVRALEVCLALAIGAAESHARNSYAGPSPINRTHIERLQKLGYKPNSRDRALLRGRR